MVEYTAPSGAKVKMTEMDFDVSYDLFMAVTKAGQEGRSKSGLDTDALLAVIVSKEIKELVFRCMERCTYNDGSGETKMTKDLFEDVKRREDFLPIALEVINLNTRPFTSHLLSGLKTGSPPETKDIPLQK